MYAYGFSQTIAGKEIAYNVFTVIDLTSTQIEEPTPGTSLQIIFPKTSDIAKGALVVKNSLPLVSPTLPKTSSSDYWKSSDMWAPYLATIKKGSQNLNALGFFASQ
jgi:hypothetical protein